MIENLELIGTGFAVVMLVLAALWGACALVGSFFTRAETAAVAAAGTAPAPEAAAPGVPPHHLAAMAAAVAHTLGAGVRVRRVQAPPHKVTDWPLEGRFETFTAHRIRTDWGPTRPTLGNKTPNILRGQKP
jgi:glutaconyl-CoA/methylmalonyl-CoA decarboxylase subunit delta